jgi:hypothetical protein
LPFGAGDVALGIKWRVVDGAPLLRDVALLPEVKLPSGGRARGTGTTDASLLLIDSRTIGGVSLDLNGGATWRSGRGAAATRVGTTTRVAGHVARLPPCTSAPLTCAAPAAATGPRYGAPAYRRLTIA